MLAGCTAQTGALGTWTWAALVLLVLGLVALAAWAGHQGARLRQALASHLGLQREQAHGKLSTEVNWAVDRDRRLINWTAPAGFARTGQDLSTAFDLGDSKDQVEAALASGSAFGPVVVRAPLDDSAWLLSGLPLHDVDGRPMGHAGIACPATADTEAGALPVLLDACPGPMMLVGREETRWAVHNANGAARRILNANQTASNLTTLDLPKALTDALDHAPEHVHDADGWQVRPFRGRGNRCFVLSRAASDGEVNDSAAFSFTVSHDLRAPIRVVEGFARIVKEDYAHVLDRIGTDHLDRVLGAAARMNQMIDAMLTLARLSSQPLARQPVNLSQLAGFVTDELRRSAADRDAEIEIEPGLTVNGDPTLLRLVLENLLGNAWKYTAKRARARIVFTHETQGDRTVFIVRDNGAGFDMRSADRLFGLFQRLHSANDFPGTGVGLASVQRIVRRHGGEIWADAEPGSGAAFHFTIGS